MRLLSLLICAALTNAAAPPIGRPSVTAIRQWQDRKFGMFIHWGLYSIPGGMWNGQRITKGYSEQIMRHAPVPKADYAALAKQFNPGRWDADAIVKLAKDAGMRFIVITSKHHDGFNMFHTRQSKYNVVDGTPYGKDVIKQLADACARGGLRFGVYYSTLDWYDDRATPWDMPNVKENDNPVPKSHEDFNVAQLKELATGYGPLSEIWFDMGRPAPEQSKRFTDTVHELQPDCMVSGRVFNHQGDFTVMGDNHIPDHIIDEPWQTPASIYHQTWGYRSWQDRSDLAGKINEHIIKLTEVVSRGGNYLLNIGPRGDGSVVEFEADVLRGIGQWVQANGDAIYGVGPQPFRKLDFGQATVKAGRLYLLVRRWPDDGALRLPGLTTGIRAAYFLADAAKTSLPVEGGPEQRLIRVAKKAETPPVTVIVAELDGPLAVVPSTIKPDAQGVVTLPATAADHFYNYNGRGYYAPATVYKYSWDFEIARAGKYRLEAFTKGGDRDTVQLTIDTTRLTAALDPSQSGPQPAGIVKLAKKRYLKLAVTPPDPFPKGTDLRARIDRIVLTPVE